MLSRRLRTHAWLRVAIFTTLSLSSTAAVRAAETEQDIAVRLENQWIDATSRGDRAAVAKLLDDDFVNTNTQGQIRRKPDVLTAPPPPAGSTQSLENISAQVVGDVIVLHGINRYRPSPGAPAIAVAFSDVFVHRKDGWRILSSHETIAPGR
jgi:Domain of unknown function (DUF4440)